MNASGTALQGKHTVEASELYMAFELGEKNWKLSLGDGARSPSRYTVAAGDIAALLECIAKAKARCGLAPEARVGSCYEAGRDGFWLHRWLIGQGIQNIVVDSASIEVNRRRRRATPAAARPLPADPHPRHSGPPQTCSGRPDRGRPRRKIPL